jgi:hypothetical protein
MPEIEPALMATQCLDRRIPDVETLRAETAAWEAERSQECITVDWHFSTDAARHKLKHLYPTYTS